MNVLKEYPDDVFTLLRIGKIHYDAGKAEASKQYFERVLEIEPENETASEQRTHRHESGQGIL